MIINIGCYRIELTKIKVTKIYSFDDLSEDVQDDVIQKYWDINVHYDWWDHIYEDAANVGIKITAFNIDRGSYCHGAIEDTEYTANKIIKEHGESCETYKTAKEYLGFIRERDDFYCENEDFDNEFRLSILEDYRIMLQKEYEYSTGREGIVETFKINEYEFTVDGELA